MYGGATCTLSGVKQAFSLPIYSMRRYAMPSYDGSLALGGGHLAI